MEVLMIDQWLPNQPYVLELGRPLSKKVSLTMITNREYQHQGEGFRCKSVLENKVKQKKWGLISYFWGLLPVYWAALAGKYDVIHVQAFKKQEFEMPAFALARRFTRKKLVYTAHNILPHERTGKRGAEQLKKWYRMCDAIIVHNEHSKQTLIGFEPSISEKIKVVPHGAFNDFKGAVGEVPHEKTVFLQFGMIRKYKGIDDLLKAASLLPGEYRKKIRIVIAGNQRKDLDDTDYQALVDEYALGDFVEFLPKRIPDEQLPDYFNGSDCCLFPYKEIYGSGALLMAYTFDKPVIASGIPAFVEETDGGKTGLLYKAGDANELKEAIERFTDMSDGDKKAIKERIRSLCSEKYNWETSSAVLYHVYRDVTGLT